MIERPKMTRSMYQALKRHILHEREKKKQGKGLGVGGLKNIFGKFYFSNFTTALLREVFQISCLPANLGYLLLNLHKKKKKIKKRKEKKNANHYSSSCCTVSS